MMIPKMLKLSYCLFFVLIYSNQATAQKHEAENATLADGASEISCASCSGEKAVEMEKNGNITFNINITETGFYNIYINVAAPSGDKINVIAIDEMSADFSVEESSTYNKLKIVSAYKINAGSHKIEIQKSWGWINVDYIELEQVDVSDRFNLVEELVTPDPIPEAEKLFQFLLDHYNKRIISGGMTLNDIDNSTWLDWIKDKTGKEVALLGLDFMHSVGKDTEWINDTIPVWDAKTWYERNGIPVLMWHWRDPSENTNAFYTDGTEFDLSKISDENSDEYKAILEDIDKVAGLIKILNDQNIPIIWRPLHEAAGGWFWWGAQGPEPLKTLWHLMFDRMVNHHGLRNIIWVWTKEPGDDEWYPGDAYVDIVGRDIYKDGNHSSHGLEFSNINGSFGGKKMITLSENGSIPDPDNLVKDEAAWSWFMPWYRDYTTDSQYNPESLWKKIMTHDYVITLDEMPDLKTYEKQDVSEPDRPEPSEPSNVTGFNNSDEVQDYKIYPTLVEDYLTIESDQNNLSVVVYDLRGRIKEVADTTGNELQLSFKGFREGFYVLKINNTHVTKVIKK